MTRRFALLFAAVLSLGAAAAGDTPPWVADGALDRATMADVGARGILAVKDHRADLEAALARGQGAIDAAAANPTMRFVLVDGLAQTVAGMALAAHDKVNGTAVANPYPRIGLMLGSYYDEIGDFEDAVRVLDLAIKYDVVAGLAGQAMPVLKGERANALLTLKRSGEAL